MNEKVGEIVAKYNQHGNKSYVEKRNGNGSSRTRTRTRMEIFNKFKQFQKFGGIAQLTIPIRIPNSYYEYIKQYCSLSGEPLKEWFNDEIIQAIEATEFEMIIRDVLKKYHIRELSDGQKEVMIQITKGYEFFLVQVTDCDKNKNYPKFHKLEKRG